MPKLVSDCTTWDEAQQNAPNGASLAGWVTVTEREMLFQLAKAMCPNQLMVEIGIYGASNLNLFGLATHESVKIVGIDPLSDEINSTHWRANGETLQSLAIGQLIKAELWGSPKVELIQDMSQNAGKTWDRPIHVLRIDGDHETPMVTQDLDLFMKWIVPGGVALLDNYSDMQTVRDAVDPWLEAQPQDEWIEKYRPTNHEVANILWLQRRGEPQIDLRFLKEFA